MEIQVRREGKVAVLALNGKLTIGEGDVLLSNQVKELLAAGSRLLVLDLSRVPYMDSAGLGEIIRANKRVRENGGTIRLVLSGKTREVLTIAAVLPVFEVYDDAASALAGFGA